MKNWLIIYDISDEKRLNKVAKVLENYGIRVQKSVFEMLARKEMIDEIFSKLDKIIDKNQDYIVYFEICDKDWQKQIKYGPGKFEILKEKDFKII